ncbi:MAG: hypothetical protein J6P72_02025 [Firmicutes bacterium]|nr:hypothetical protein [Bacillota bacterium]
MEQHQWKDVHYRGTIVRVDYRAQKADGTTWLKYANVYLPYGYDETKPYNILYLMHGGGGNPDAWLDCSQIKNALDRGFAEERSKPFIVVFPTYYNLNPAERRSSGIDAAWENAQVFGFQKELEEALIPAVEGRFHTFADGTDHQALVSSRRHRAFSGFSMGGCTTWYAFMEHLDIIGTFLPLSGDCWVIEPTGGKEHAAETAKALAECVRRFGYTKDDFKLLIATGDLDIAYGNLTPQVEAMKAYPELFGDMQYVVKEGAVHAYEEVYHHIWNYLPQIF